MVRLLHTADWQMGRQYGRFDPEDGASLAGARFSTVANIAALATAQQVDAVLVAGDVFDMQAVSDRTIRRVFNALEGYAGPWILIPGNHDAALAESVWTRAARLSAVPDNAHLLLQAQVREYAQLGFAVLAAPLTQRQTYADLTAWFDTAQTPEGLLRVGLAHGCVQGILPQEIDSSNPIAADRARRARLDYLALGDWHGLREVDARTWYSGTPEPERFKDNGAGQVLIVDLAGPGEEPVVTPHPIGQFLWQSWGAHFAVGSDLEALLQRLAQVAPNLVLELVLSGELDLEGDQRLQQALSVAQGQCRSLQCDRSSLQLVPTDEDIAALHVDGYVGEVMAQLRAQQEGSPAAQARVARDALAIMASLLRDAAARGDSA